MQKVLNGADFNKYVDVDGKVVVEFFATWCPHCQAEQPVTDAFAERMRGKVAVYQVDVDASPDLVERYGVEGFPWFVLFEDGKQVARLIGEQPEAALIEFVTDE